MFKNKKMLLLLAVLVVIAVAIFFVRKKKNETQGKDDNTFNGSSSGSAAMPEASFPLRPYSMAGEYSAAKGSYGQQIANLQKLCNEKYGAGLTVDGKWGPKTDEVFRSRLGTLLFTNGISEAQYNVFMNQ